MSQRDSKGGAGRNPGQKDKGEGKSVLRLSGVAYSIIGSRRSRIFFFKNWHILTDRHLARCTQG